MKTSVRDCEQLADCIVMAARTGDKVGIDSMMVGVSEAELITTCLILGKWLSDEIGSYR